MDLVKDDITGVLRISGTLGIEEANSLREALLDCLLHQEQVTADLSQVDRCDAAALQVLLAGWKNATASGKGFCLKQPSQAVMQTFSALGFSLEQAGNSWRGEADHAG